MSNTRQILTNSQIYMALSGQMKKHDSGEFNLSGDVSQTYEVDKTFGKEGVLKTDNGGLAAALRNKETGNIVMAFGPFDDGANDINGLHDAGKKQYEAMKPSETNCRMFLDPN